MDELEQMLEIAAAYILGLLPELLNSEIAQVIMAPGLVILEAAGFSASGGLILVVLLFGWYFWLWLIRFTYFVFGRATGFSSISHYYAFTCLWLPWQGPYQKLLRIMRYLRQRRYGKGSNQQWAGFLEMASYPFNPDSGAVLVGRLAIGQRFGLHMPVALPDGGKSVVYVSYAGGGKTSQLATWLGCLPKAGSAVVFDMEGALVDAFGASLRAAGHKVVKLDPDRLAKGFDTFGHWNPFDELTAIKNRLGSRYVIEFAETLAHALIVPDSKTQPVFANQARIFVKALILWVWLLEKEKTLKRFRVLLNRGLEELVTHPRETGFGRLLFEMSAVTDRYQGGDIDDGAEGTLFEFIANSQGLMSAMGDGKKDDFKNTAVYQTQWIDDIKVHEMTAYSDVAGVDLKLTNTVVFMVCTLTDMQKRLGPLMRAFIMMTLYAFEKVEPKKVMKIPCLFLLDEFPNVGKMETVETALPGFRKYGVRLVIAAQSVGLLRAAYPEKYQEFFNQSQCVVWMGIAPTDSETLRYLGSVLGRRMQKDQIERNLLETQEASAFLNRAYGQVIITREGGEPPLRLKRLEYWKDLSVREYAAHKGHGESFFRSLTRNIWT